MFRTILHVDLNNFYASVECLYRPELKSIPVAVCGDVEARHGIVLAKNYPAKQLGIQTGEAIWQAKQKAKNLVIIPPDFKKYLRFSRMAREIYATYTDQIEPFGIDEAWLDVTSSAKIFGDGESIANMIRQRMKNELGLTVSIGVSFNKIFAKLGSDMKKPDAVTVIAEENFKEIVWPLNVRELLYVGRSTQNKLYSRNVNTIGDLANKNLHDLKLLLGVWGETLWSFANGFDYTHVRKVGEESIIKSIGNSTTTVRDLLNINDVKIIIYILSESVAARLRQHGLKCTTVAISVRDKELYSFDRQSKLSEPTYTSNDIASKAIELFNKNYTWYKPIRSLAVRGANLVTETEHMQIDLFDIAKEKHEKLDKVVDVIRRRFGNGSICRAAMLSDKLLSSFNPKDDHVIHPISFFR
ncbi:DNA polymerase IV [Anaerosinus massiliensis]|uniref:DNA polymerase IV n=1 Tax=Massilibacillus massiliensis TaxID=1806837 RepID=UPI000B2948E5|nr:DNA polymerase IV [Massilibacillus massiliensis]